MDEHADELEAERARLAAKIQRALIDPLNLLLSQAQAYEHAFAAQPAARTSIGVMAALARQVLQQALDLDADLQAAGLADLGLDAALELLAGRAMRAHGMRVALSLSAPQSRLSPALELALFRLAQDYMARAARALARHVALALRRGPGRLELAIDDDGDPSVELDLLALSCRRLERLGATTALATGPRGGLALTCGIELAPGIPLTPREQEILGLLAEGLSNKMIAARLSLSPRTINFHLDNLYGKLGVRTRTEAAIQALRLRTAER